MLLLSAMLKRFISRGRLTVIDADGQSHEFGERPVVANDRGLDLASPPVTLRLHDRALHRKLALSPRMSYGEAYMNGTLTIENGGTIYDLLTLLMTNVQACPSSGPLALVARGAGTFLRAFQQYNPLSRARQNVAHHYDLSSALYDLFLDTDRQYSCGYFAEPSDDLETAQLRKKQHLASKLLLRPGQKVLDIGSGWGGLALYLARETGVDVTGLTLSVEQHKAAAARAEFEHLDRNVRFHLRDYREETGRYDRIVSVGMFEHVGVVHYTEFFERIAALLADDGVALLHSIGRADGPGSTNPWLRKYIFPGGYSPALSEVLPAIERAGLWVTDIEILRLHYAETLRHWRLRFVKEWDRVASLYDERFCRMWEFYLAACEAAFRVQDLMVFQIQMAKRIDAVPITRDYMVDWERAHPVSAGVERRTPRSKKIRRTATEQ